MARSDGIFLRALVAFLALPGIVAFAVPLLLLRPAGRTRLEPDGALVLAIGCLVLLACVREFYVAGKGTLAPWAPPRHLVTSGLYRYSRNPMYVGVLLVVGGWALAFRSTSLAVYAITLVVAFHLRVVLGEEPWLARTHGEAWEHYRHRVPRWAGTRGGSHGDAAA
jgi:protein-S-isoprenylcysteine O-methyltransferase Ste14